METKERFNIYLPSRLKRRLKELAQDKNMKMNDLVVSAVADMLDRQDGKNSAPDFVLERLSQVLNSQVLLTQRIDRLTTQLQKHEPDNE